MIVDAWMQFPNRQFLLDPMFEALRRWRWWIPTRNATQRVLRLTRERKIEKVQSAQALHFASEFRDAIGAHLRRYQAR